MRPTQTNSCPLEIKQNLRPTYRVDVLFADKQDYEIVGSETTDKKEVNRILWAYVTVSNKHKIHRPQKDENRLVRGVRLYVPEMPFEAVFFDLPGIGGVNEPYRPLVAAALADADCIIYVTYAQKELHNNELRLIEEID